MLRRILCPSMHLAAAAVDTACAPRMRGGDVGPALVALGVVPVGGCKQALQRVASLVHHAHAELARLDALGAPDAPRARCNS